MGHIRNLIDRGKPATCPVCFGPVKVKSFIAGTVSDHLARFTIYQESELLEVVRKPGPMARATSGEPDTLSSVEVRPTMLDSSSTKLNALLRALRLLREQDPCYRAVVFSQWTSLLDLIALALDREEIAWSRLDGSMTQTTRTKAIDVFMKPTRSPRIFIIVSDFLFKRQAQEMLKQACSV